MKKLLAAALVAFPVLAQAEVLTGTFKTAPGDTGGWLHVRFEPCASDQSETCAQIIQAYSEDGSVAGDYEHLGKAIVWGMEDKGNGRWGSGKIWAPDRDKTYNSKMQIEGNILTVEGCVAFICRAQVWQRVR